MANSINTNISAYFAQANISTASSQSSASVARLSSGNRIVKASDDVAALSTGTSLRTQVLALKTALTNASQGTSLLQVADGALAQVTEILQRQKAISLQAGSGSLTDVDRSYLDQEFQALSTEIDRLTGSTNFNGVKLLNGSLSQAATVDSSTNQASVASATISLASNLASGETLVINGVTLTATSSAPSTAQFQIGATTADTVRNIADKLNALATNYGSVTLVGGASSTYATALGGATYSVNSGASSTLNISSKTGGSLGDAFTLTAGTSNDTTRKVSIGGQYGGATINLIKGGVGFGSATTAITSGTSAQSLSIPFKSGDAITATVGGSSAVSLYTLQADDSLTDIVAGINSNSATTGFTATIVPGATSGYNIELRTANSTGNISLSGGANYFATASTGAQTYQLNGATSTINLLSSSFAATSAGGAIVGASAGASTPFVDASELYISIAGGAKVSIASLETGDTVASIVTKINNSQTAGALGIVASLSESNNNISITYNDPTQTTGAPSAVTFSSGLNTTTNNTYNTDALGQSTGSALNGAVVKFNLLASGVAAPDAAVVSANGAGTAQAPIEAGTAITVAFNTDATTLGSSIIIANSGNVTAGLTLQQLAGVINADADSLAKGIHATVVQDGSGYNIQLSYAASAVPALGTGGDASATGVRLTYDNSTVGGTGAYTPTATLSNPIATPYSQSNLFATGFTTALGGQYVVSVASPGNGTANVPFGSDAIITLRSDGVAVSSAITVGASATIQSIVDQINNDTTAQGNGITAEVVSDGITANIRIKQADTARTGLTVGVLDFTVTNAVQTNTFASHAIQTADATYVSGSSVATANYTTYRMFNNDWTGAITAGQAVIGTTGNAATPFQAGDLLRVNLNYTGDTPTFVTLVTSLTAGTLGDLVNQINANTGTSNFSAELDGNGTNILLRYQGTAAINGRLSFDGGNNFFHGLDSTTGGFTGGLNNSYSTNNLFATGFTTGSGGAYVISSAASGSGSANIPFDGDDATLLIRVAGSPVTSAISVGASQTVQGLIDLINNDPTANQNGVHAYLIDNGSVVNIGLSFADEANTGLTAGTITTTTAGTANDFSSHALVTTAATYNSVDNILTTARTTTATTENGAVGLVNEGTFGLVGGADNGFGYGSTSVSGTVADSLLTGLAQNKARSFISFPDIDASALTAAGNFNSDGSVNITVGGKSFSFVTAVTSADQILIGSTLKETLDNAVSTINNYGENVATGDVAYQLNQINVSRSGNSILIEGKNISNVLTMDGTSSTVAISSGFTNGATVSSANLSNSSRNASGTFGVDVSGISNIDFTGKIQGFEVTYAGTANTVNISVKVGEFTYTASNVDTNPISGNKAIRFTSDVVGSGASARNGGFFDIQLSSNNGQTISPSTATADATVYEQRLNAAFNGLSFGQSRLIESYSGTQSITSGTTLVGSLLGSSVSAKLSSYDAVKLTNIEVAAPQTGGADASIKLTVNGQVYSTSGLGSQLGANQTYRLTNSADSTQYIEFRTGTSDIDLSTSDYAEAVQTALGEAFGVSNGGGALSFQIGSSSSDTLNVSIGSAQTSNLFDGKTLNVLTQANATIAGDQLDKALASITTLRASVGALQSRFNFASANIQIAVQNQDAARGELLDTDVATESTSFATSQVKLQAGISVLAQANQQLQNLLKLIQ